MAQKHPELQGRKKTQFVTHIKKGTRMPAAEEGEATKLFYVAEGVRMGAPDGSGALKGGDPVKLTKKQAEWCMANSFIDSILPDFEEGGDDATKSDGSSDADSAPEKGTEPSAEGKGTKDVGGTSSPDGDEKADGGSPRRSGRKV